ncbi:MAG: hypothetical protein ABI868_19205 [Acidobacteriota bacterium]
MILHFNHVSGGTSAKSLGDLTGLVVGSIVSQVEQGTVDARLLSSLRVHLDWVHYKHNFREAVSVRRATRSDGRALALAEIAVDLRQADPARLGQDLADALRAVDPDIEAGPGDAVRLEDFTPLRLSIIWHFNRLFWEQLEAWESAAGHRYELTAPSVQADASHPQAVADSVGDFWTLLRDLEARGQLPDEVFALEIGSGSGGRAAAWLDRFKALDQTCGTGYYARLRFLLGDCSEATLKRALAAVAAHAPAVSVLAIDALNPFRTLSYLRSKVLYVHLTNVYDNLAFDEMVRRDGRLYLVETRAYVSANAADRLQSEFGVTREQLPAMARQLCERGPEAVSPGEPGILFWRALWDALRLEERLRAIDEADEAHVPPELTRSHLDDLLAEAPEDVRFHVSRGAAESFANTLPLLHPRGFLQVQDIFVTSMEQYRQGFRGPGKLDGSIVTWVNGPLLRAVGARAGYDVHFAPFRYRPESKATILYTTPRP